MSKRINSCTKGKVGEREVRDMFRAAGFEARRGRQYSGSPDSPDVVTSLDKDFHVEAKRVEKLQIDKAMAQALRDKGPDQMPLVFHRKNRTKWLVTLQADDLIWILTQLYPCYPTPSTPDYT